MQRAMAIVARENWRDTVESTNQLERDGEIDLGSGSEWAPDHSSDGGSDNPREGDSYMGEWTADEAEAKFTDDERRYSGEDASEIEVIDLTPPAVGPRVFGPAVFVNLVSENEEDERPHEEVVAEDDAVWHGDDDYEFGPPAEEDRDEAMSMDSDPDEVVVPAPVKLNVADMAGDIVAWAKANPGELRQQEEALRRAYAPALVDDKDMTIADRIEFVLKEAKTPMTRGEIYNALAARFPAWWPTAKKPSVSCTLTTNPAFVLVPESFSAGVQKFRLA